MDSGSEGLKTLGIILNRARTSNKATEPVKNVVTELVYVNQFNEPGEIMQQALGRCRGGRVRGVG